MIRLIVIKWWNVAAINKTSENFQDMIYLKLDLSLEELENWSGNEANKNEAETCVIYKVPKVKTRFPKNKFFVGDFFESKKFISNFTLY